MRWLIDGYNVVRRDADLRAAESESLHAGRRALLRLVAAAARRSTDRFTVVFDGAPGAGRAEQGGQVEVVFSRPPERADDVVVRLARQLGDGGVVVSSDRAVQAAARRARCAAVEAEAFLDALRAPAGEPAGEGEDDEDDGPPEARRGNPRRPSREQRTAWRALRRLRGGPLEP